MTQVTLLDGGVGQELVRRSAARPTPLWATDAMRHAPGLAQAVHADFLAAGATVLKANTYAIHRDRLAREGLEDRFEALHDQALSEAQAARDAAGGGRIAGCIGPLGASYRADSSRHMPRRWCSTPRWPGCFRRGST